MGEIGSDGGFEEKALMEYGQEKIMLEGMVTQIVYRNEANGYTVMELMTNDGEELTAVGVQPHAGPGRTGAARGCVYHA